MRAGRFERHVGRPLCRRRRGACLCAVFDVPRRRRGARAADGRVFAAANVENAAFPVGTCAEAGAIAAMVSAGGRHIVEALVVGAGPDLVTPCGACRQRLREFAAADLPVHVAGPGGVRAGFTPGMLLPEAFGPAMQR